LSDNSAVENAGMSLRLAQETTCRYSVPAGNRINNSI
jgi:hypothetical protein